MHIWQKRGLRTFLSMVFFAALMFGVTSVPAANAGSLPKSDAFDPSPKYNWQVEYNASYGAGGFEYNQGTAFSPQTNAWLAATNGWSALRLSLGVPADDPHENDLCTASIYIKPAVNDSVTFNLEVIDPYTWQYIALKQVTLLKGGGYKQVSVSWRSSREYVNVRFSLLSNTGYYKKARLDNFYAYCVFSPL